MTMDHAQQRLNYQEAIKREKLEIIFILVFLKIRAK
jgi:hypothetical protein